MKQTYINNQYNATVMHAKLILECILKGLYIYYLILILRFSLRTPPPRHGKIHFFYVFKVWAKLIYPIKCVNSDKSEFMTKQRKMYLTTSMSKIRLSHIYNGNNYVIYPLSKAKVKKILNKTPKYYPKTRKIAKLLTFVTKQCKIWHTFYPS